MPFAVIFGAGKIARGFIAHLLSISGVGFVFVERSEALVGLMNQRGSYKVNVLGAPGKSAVLTGVRALSCGDSDAVGEAVARADAVFTAVGGKNLGEAAPVLADALGRRYASDNRRYLNVVTCENWKEPAEVLRMAVSASLDVRWRGVFEETTGFTEAVVLRSAIEPGPDELAADPLAVNAQDYWELPVDASRLKGELPAIRGIRKIEAFQGFLEQKFYTYNAANGAVSYLGYIRGYGHIADAAHDPDILNILDGVYRETGTALSRKHGFSPESQMAFAGTSLKKLQDYTIVDFIERNARDPLRKLGPDDRLVGSARLALQYGVKPVNLAAAIAAAIHYDEPSDPSALELAALRRKEGVDGVLAKVCRIDSSGELAMLVREQDAALVARGWIKNGGGKSERE